jgi:hypothetical protein
MGKREKKGIEGIREKGNEVACHEPEGFVRCVAWHVVRRKGKSPCMYFHIVMRKS